MSPSSRASASVEGAPSQASAAAPSWVHYAWPVRIAGDADAVEAATRQWVVDRGLALASHARARFDRVQVGLLVACTYPDVSHADRRLAADFLAWVFLQDDRLDEARDGHDAGAVADVFRGYLDVVGGRPARPGEPNNVRVLDELATRLRARASDVWMDRFRESLRGFWLDGVVVETAYRQRGVVPTRAEYLAQRVHSIGVLQVLDLAELFRGTPLPPEIRHDESHEALRDAAARIIACANDLYSYDKERRAGDPNNLVTVLVQHEGMTLEQALDEVVRVHDEEVVVLESLAAGALRRFPQHHVAVAGWIEDVRAWIVGALEWTERAARYASGRELLGETRRRSSRPAGRASR
ncbi:MAG: terpene synthase family protein [Sandaracinus sp.]